MLADRRGPPRWIAPLYLHHNDDETWYVLEGAMCVRVGKDVVEARSGSALFVSRARLIRIGIRVPDQYDMYW